MYFDTVRFLKDRFQNPSGLAAFASAYSFSLNQSAVEKWFQRGRVPSEWFSVLLALLELETGQPVRLAGYLGRGRHDHV